jgi:diguanylate cyclase (GGDEF)-like protein
MDDDGGRDACTQCAHVAHVLGEALRFAKTATGLLACLALRIDRLGMYCDTFGSGVGQALFGATMERIKNTVRTTDAVVPCGPEIFVVLRGLCDADEAAAWAAHILAATSMTLVLPNVPTLRPVTNIGLCVYPLDGRSAAELIDAAHVALDRAVKRGRNGLERYRANG